jgi:hypothetical protein
MAVPAAPGILFHRHRPRRGGNSRKGLPTHFGIDPADYVYDCTVSGTAVNCASARKSPYDGIDSWKGKVTGTLSGLTMTGTVSVEQTGHAVPDPGCLTKDTWSGPAAYTFSLDGTVRMREGPTHWQQSLSGSCSGSGGNTVPVAEWTATWSAIE